jgi:hypothetical protein
MSALVKKRSDVGLHFGERTAFPILRVNIPKECRNAGQLGINRKELLGLPIDHLGKRLLRNAHQVAAAHRPSLV